MKAITCSQCGALIKRISLKDKFAHCDYCGAKILIVENRERIFEIPDKPPAPPKILPKLDQRDRDRLFQTMLEENDGEHAYDNAKKIFSTVVALIFFGALAYIPIRQAIPSADKTAADTKKTRAAAPVALKQTPEVEVEVRERLPEISYRSYVKHNTNIGADLIEMPVITLEQLPTTDLKELRKTVFAQRNIRVRITIDEQGDVVAARALNGHQVLRDSSVEAAKKSLFSARKRRTTTVLTYIYILEK